MKRAFTCIVCPNGCEIEAEYKGGRVLAIAGNLCPKGVTYVTQELVDPGAPSPPACRSRAARCPWPACG